MRDALVGLARDRRVPRSSDGPAARASSGAFSIEAMTRGYADLLADLARRPRRRGSQPARERDGAMKPPHVVIVNQNALLEVDLRPRREAETLAAAGYAVTLVGGCGSPRPCAS